MAPMVWLVFFHSFMILSRAFLWSSGVMLGSTAVVDVVVVLTVAVAVAPLALAVTVVAGAEAVVVVVVSVFLLQPTSAIATINGVANFNAVDIVLYFRVFGLYELNNECYYQSVD